MRNLIKSVILILATAYAGAVWAQGAYVIDGQGNRIQGQDIIVKQNGDLELKIGNATRGFRSGSYKYAFVPKPNDVVLLEKALEQERFDVIVQQAPRIFENFKFVGWGGRIAYLEGSAYLEQKNYQKALDVFQNGERYAGPQMDQIMRGKVRAYLALDRAKDATPLLETLRKAEAPEIAAFAFNASGQLLEKQGKNKEAVLQYLKAVLLFEPAVGGYERKQAKQNVVALLKQMGDERHKTFQSME